MENVELLLALANAVKDAREQAGVESIGTLQLELWLREEAVRHRPPSLREAFLKSAGLPEDDDELR